MSATGIEISRDQHTMAASIDRADGNRFTRAMTRALADAVAGASREPGIRFLRIRAEGTSFCLGREQEGQTTDELRQVAAGIVEVNEALRTSPLISLCEVQGDAAGFGVGLVAAADVAVAADSARFWFPELDAGLAPTVVLGWLPRLLPQKLAFELVATGRRLAAAEAARWGLVTEVVAEDEVNARADAWIEGLAQRSAPALKDAKAFLSLARGMDDSSAARASVDALVIGSARLREDQAIRAEADA